MLQRYQMLQGNLVAAAEKMPEEHYGFRPTPEIKPFGQLVAHVAIAQFGTCAALKGEPNPRKEEKEEAHAAPRPRRSRCSRRRPPTAIRK